MAMQHSAGTHRGMHVPGLSQPVSIAIGVVVVFAVFTVLSGLLWHFAFGFPDGQAIVLAVFLSVYLGLVIGIMSLIGFGVTHDHNY